MSREIMQQALDKFEHLWEIGIDAEYKVDLMPEICALRVELAKPEQEQEPESHIVKWSIPVDPNNFGEPLVQVKQSHYSDIVSNGGLDPRNKFDAPPRKPWVGLTQEDRDELLNYSTNVPSRLIDWTEEKLKEKNEH
jgi:hypothetical protein